MKITTEYDANTEGLTLARKGKQKRPVSQDDQRRLDALRNGQPLVFLDISGSEDLKMVYGLAARLGGILKLEGIRLSKVENWKDNSGFTRKLVYRPVSVTA